MYALKMPEPEPMSSTVLPGLRCVFRASRQYACMCGAEIVTPLVKVGRRAGIKMVHLVQSLLS